MCERGIGDVLATITFGERGGEEFVPGFQRGGQILNERSVVTIDGRAFEVDIESVKVMRADVLGKLGHKAGAFRGVDEIEISHTHGLILRSRTAADGDEDFHAVRMRLGDQDFALRMKGESSARIDRILEGDVDVCKLRVINLWSEGLEVDPIRHVGNDFGLRVQ